MFNPRFSRARVVAGAPENRASAAISSTAETDPARTLWLSLYRVAF